MTGMWMDRAPKRSDRARNRKITRRVWRSKSRDGARRGARGLRKSDGMGWGGGFGSYLSASFKGPGACGPGRWSATLDQSAYRSTRSFVRRPAARREAATSATAWLPCRLGFVRSVVANSWIFNTKYRFLTYINSTKTNYE